MSYVVRRSVAAAWRAQLCLTALLVAVPDAVAGPYDLREKRTMRVTHPCFQSVAPCKSYIWNQTYTKLIVFEAPYHTREDPECGGSIGRRWIVRPLHPTEDPVLREWSSFAEYWDDPAITIDLPDDDNGVGGFSDAYSIRWSVLQSEEDILYATFETSVDVCELKRLDTSAPPGGWSWTSVMDVTPDDGQGCTDLHCMGFTRDGDPKLICAFAYENLSRGGWEIDVSAQTKTRITNWPGACEPDFARYPSHWSDHCHGATSPLGQYRAISEAGCWRIVMTDLGTCNEVARVNDAPGAVHFSWNDNEQWFFTNSGGDNRCGQSTPGPDLEPYSIYQVYWDGQAFEYNPILTQDTAMRWDDGSTVETNYFAHFIHQSSRNSQYLAFHSTNGSYSYADFTAKGATPWDFVTVYLSELEEKCDEGAERVCGEGACAGQQQCVAGTWSTCDGPAPSTEICDNGVDDDCDGQTDGADDDCSSYVGGSGSAGAGATTGGPTEGDGDDACACAAPGRRSSGSWALLLLAGVPLAVRLASRRSRASR